MASAFETFYRIGPAAFVLKAILGAIAANFLLLGVILVRRSSRRRYFARRDAKVFEFRKNWNALIFGKIPYQTWQSNKFSRKVLEAMVLDAFENADERDSAQLLNFLRASGLLDTQIFEAKSYRGWRRHRALVALGRTRAPEAIPALAEGLRDRMLETRLAALRGLERMACPEAAKAILDWMAEKGLRVPTLPLQSALIQCCAERPQILLPYMQHATKNTREVLGRVLGEVATAAIAAELLRFVDDDLPEMRAAAARALAQAETGMALEVLNQLTQDQIWFVRLRAVVSLGKISHPRAVPGLLRGLRDSNRLVRLRAAEALVNIKVEEVATFEKVIALRDRYALHAYLTALDNAGLLARFEATLLSCRHLNMSDQEIMLDVLRSGNLPDDQRPALRILAAQR